MKWEDSQWWKSLMKTRKHKEPQEARERERLAARELIDLGRDHKEHEHDRYLVLLETYDKARAEVDGMENE